MTKPDSCDPLTEDNEAHQPGRALERCVQWLMIAVVALTTMAIAGAYLPPRMRLLVLFPLLFGLAGGMILGEAARRLEFPARLPVVLVSAALVAAGLCGMFYESYRSFARAIAEQQRNDPEIQRARQLLGDPELPDELRRTLAAALRENEERRSVPAYLQRRVSALGDWTSPWPEAFLIAEILLAGIAGALAVVRLAAGPLNAPKSSG